MHVRAIEKWYINGGIVNSSNGMESGFRWKLPPKSKLDARFASHLNSVNCMLLCCSLRSPHLHIGIGFSVGFRLVSSPRTAHLHLSFSPVHDHRTHHATHGQTINSLAHHLLILDLNLSVCSSKLYRKQQFCVFFLCHDATIDLIFDYFSSSFP